MPQVFWATCPFCDTRFTCEKEIWDNDNAMLCPSCLKYFKRKDSPHIETVWPITLKDIQNAGKGAEK
jgi:hypothetical protein